jgi:hypothetical protein
MYPNVSAAIAPAVAALLVTASCAGQNRTARLTFEETPIWTVGTDDGTDGGAIFGRIVDVGVTADGGVVVLDEMNAEITWFDSAGIMVDRVGRSGAGPGEFSVPRGLYVSPEDGILILDARNVRISNYMLEGGEFKYVYDEKIQLIGRDLCLLGDTTIVNGFGTGAALFQLGLHGDGQRAFAVQLVELGEDARTSSWFDRTWLQNDGFLACQAPNTIVFAHRELPYVRAFDASGNELWRQRLHGFSRVHWEAKDEGRRMQEAPDPATGIVTYSRGVALGADGEVVLVGTHEWWYGEPVRYYTYVLDAHTGEQLARVQSPFILIGYRNGIAYGYEREPYPRVSAYRARLVVQ